MGWKPLIKKTEDRVKEFGLSFFPIPKLNTPRGEPILIRLKDKQTRYKVEDLPRRQKKISLAYVLDSNAKPNDGRAYLIDQYIVDTHKHRLIEYSRKIIPRNKNIWVDKINKYRQSPTPSPTEAEDHFFSITNIRDNEHPNLIPIATRNPHILKAFYSQKTFFKKTLELVNQTASLPQIRIKIHDPQNHYSVIERNFTKETILSLVLDTDDKRQNGRLIVHDRFIEGKSPSKYFRWVRRWEGVGTYRMKKLAKKLNQQWKDDIRNKEFRKLLQSEGKNYYQAIKIIWSPSPGPSNHFSQKTTKIPAKEAPIVSRLAEKVERPVGELQNRLKSLTPTVQILRKAYRFTSAGKEIHSQNSFLKTFGKLLQKKFLVDQIKINKIKFLLIVKPEKGSGRISVIGFDRVEWDNHSISWEEIQNLLNKMAMEINQKYRLPNISGEKLKIPVNLIKN